METTQTTLQSPDNYGKLLLRVVLALLLLFHGTSKLIGGIGFIGGMLEKAGLPAGLGYLVYIGEVVAPLLMLVGHDRGADAGAHQPVFHAVGHRRLGARAAGHVPGQRTGGSLARRGALQHRWDSWAV